MNTDEFLKDTLRCEQRAASMKDKVKALQLIDTYEAKWQPHYDQIFNTDAMWDRYTDVTSWLWRKILYSCTDKEWDRYGNSLPD